MVLPHLVISGNHPHIILKKDIQLLMQRISHIARLFDITTKSLRVDKKAKVLLHTLEKVTVSINDPSVCCIRELWYLVCSMQHEQDFSFSKKIVTDIKCIRNEST